MRTHEVQKQHHGKRPTESDISVCRHGRTENNY
jgi:hypothetical protein